MTQISKYTILFYFILKYAQAISIKPADFDRLIMPCYLSSSNANNFNDNFNNLQLQTQNANYAATRIPRANSIDNFVALLTKIEAANPRLADNPEQLIRLLLSRFRMDNYYYNVRERMPISDQNQRVTDITSAILNHQMQSDLFPETLLDNEEKCSMYFMLSHYIDKTSPLNLPLASIPINQLSGPMAGQRPPVLQAAGAAYPARSAESNFGSGLGGTNNQRYPGPAPQFGSQATSNMNAFGTGLSNQPEYSGRNPYGSNVPQPNNQLNLNLNNARNQGPYSGTATSNTRYSSPYVEGGAGAIRDRNERQAYEFGVVTAGHQENAAIVLNRVLMGILAATSPPQSIRQLASTIYPLQPITNTPRIDDEIDPLFAVTLADLWATSAIPKAGKPFDLSSLGDNGRWNDTMCPTSFVLERANSIKFTTAQLIGGLDGINLGMLRRRLVSLRKNMRLSEMLKIYYSKDGFRPQFADVGVCNRASAISTQLDDLYRQAEMYLRLYQLNLPITDNEISQAVNRLGPGFKDLTRQVASQLAPQDICQDTSSSGDIYPMNSQDQCEIARADIVTVLDTSPQANTAFMHLVVAKLAQKLGLSRKGNSLTILTNQQDTTGYAGTYSLNAIVRNSTNTAEIGCSLAYDNTRGFQGGQVTDPTRLIEMFETALIKLKNTGGSQVLIWFNYGPQTRLSSLASRTTNWYSSSPAQAEQPSQYKFYESKRLLRENFRGASIIAVASSREDVKEFVYDETRDIITDIPSGSSGSSGDYFGGSSGVDSASLAAISGPADQLVSKLMQRMCDIPSMFNYPMCYRVPSDNTPAVGYISPGRRQYWMMSPKTFFSSRSVRLAFKVEGGRLRVCFGRMARPDESGMRNQQRYESSGISLSGSASASASSSAQSQSPSTSSSSLGFSSSSGDYYTGLEYGICKDVSPGQDIDFIVSDPCYKKAIADCEPFYFVINEISNPGEGDPNYMCKDEGCKRLDQVKFVLIHSGISCSSASGLARPNVGLILVCILLSALLVNGDAKQIGRNLARTAKTIFGAFIYSTLVSTVPQVRAQLAGGVYDFGQGRMGEKRGSLTPGETAAILILVMSIIVGLALTIGLCYYVVKRSSKGRQRVPQSDNSSFLH